LQQRIELVELLAGQVVGARGGGHEHPYFGPTASRAASYPVVKNWFGSLARLEQGKKSKSESPDWPARREGWRTNSQAIGAEMTEPTDPLQQPDEPKGDEPRATDTPPSPPKPPTLDITDEEWIAASQSCCGKHE
jgi:hypothetical protein